MEAAADEPSFDPASFAPSPWISLSPFPSQVYPSPRRLSSHFTPPTRPVRAAKQLAWVSLQGRLVGAEEASSAKRIGGGLSREEAVAWELFSPMHRILIVAVIAVAAANSKKNKQIVQLTKSVEIRDKVLLGMQQKLDNLCEQVNYLKDPPDFLSDNFKFSACGCRLCDHHQIPSKSLEGDFTMKKTDEEDIIKRKVIQNDVEPEERRMSDLSDWAPSVGSAVDCQWNGSSTEEDLVSLREECEAKDDTIKELSAFLSKTESLGSKRISELEDIIRRKNMIITKLRKDMLVLEQKVIHLMRHRRNATSKPSFGSTKLPLMTDNLVYDMDSTTGPSSSDSDSNKIEPRVSSLKAENVLSEGSRSRSKQKTERPGSSDRKAKPTKRPPRPMSPLKEKCMNQEGYSWPRSGDNKSITSKSRVSQKRWV